MRQLYTFADFESRSNADLSSLGGRRYSEHLSTEVLCAVIRHPDLGRIEWWPEVDDCPASHSPEAWRAIAARLGEYPVVAHNGMTFDRFLWAKLGWPEPPEWVDTAELARKMGLPKVSLDFCAQYFLGVEKDHEGNAFTLALSRWRSKPTKGSKKTQGKPVGWTTPVTPEIMARVVQYCGTDVDQMCGFFHNLEPWIEVDREVSRVERVINDRGVCFDRESAQALVELDAVLAERACEAAGATGDVVRSGPKLKAAFAARGLEVPDCTAETIDSILALRSSVLDPVRLLAEARRANASIASGKLQAGLRLVCPDGRLRGAMGYYGAHTGRWIGKGMQLQNMTKGGYVADVEGTLARLRGGDVTAIYGHAKPFKPGQPANSPTTPPKAMATLTRATLTAPPGFALVVADLSQVEARGLAWAAGDQEALEIFREGKIDPYRRAAGRLYGVDPLSIPKDDPRRQFGKTLELACGYGMGWAKFEAKAVEDGIDWSKVAFDPQFAVNTWREIHAPIVQFWRDLEDAARETVRDTTPGVARHAGPFTWIRLVAVEHGGFEGIFCLLPSGRPIRYHNLRQERSEKRRGVQLVYDGKKGPEHTYGGKLTENVIQAMCRDFMAESLILAENDGLRPVFDVHDEAVCEVAEAEADAGLELLLLHMCHVPDWAPGMPLAAEGFVTKRYRK